MSKTYEECRDKIAKNHLFEDWDDLCFNLNFDDIDDLQSLSNYCKEAALLYGEIMYQNGYFEALKDIQNLRDHSNDISKPIKF